MINITYEYEDIDAALYWAARKGHLDVVKYLESAL